MIELSELTRVRDSLRRLEGQPAPAIGLFSWTQNLTGFAGEAHRAISHEDTAGALNGKPQNIIWCGAETWQLPTPLRNDDGTTRYQQFVDPHGQPQEINGKPVLVEEQSSIEYRGLVVLERTYQADSRFLPTALCTGLAGGATTKLLKCTRSAGEVLGRIHTALALLWGAQNPPAYGPNTAGPLIIWFSAMVTLQENSTLVGNLLKPFWHWRVDGPNTCEFSKPGTYHESIDPTRSVAIIYEPVRASLQMIDWLIARSRTLTATPAQNAKAASNEVTQFKQLLVDDIFSQAWAITDRLRSASNYGPETFETFEPHWERLKDGLNRVGAVLQSLPPEIRVALEGIAAIVNEAYAGISFADVCKSLAESQLASWSDKGWRAYKAATVPPVISWSTSSTPMNPSTAVSASTPLIQSLRRARERFTQGAVNQKALSVLLVHRSELCFPEPPDWPMLSEFQAFYRLNIGSGPHSEPKQLFDDSGQPLVAQKTIRDRNGNPILLRNGSPAAMWPGASRMYSFCGRQTPTGSESDYSSACSELIDAANEAGSILNDLPVQVRQVIWREWPAGYLKPDDADLWVNAVFELAWQKHIGSGLTAERWVWLDNKKMKIEDLSKTSQSQVFTFFSDLIERAGDPPSYWYSWIPSIWRASVACIDVLEALIDVGRSGSTKAEMDSDEGASTVADIVRLERDTPALDLTSDDWIKATDRRMKAEASTDSLKTMRNAMTEGARKSADKTFGVDKSGRRWRKVTKESTAVYYWRLSLKSRIASDPPAGKVLE